MACIWISNLWHDFFSQGVTLKLKVLLKQVWFAKICNITPCINGWVVGAHWRYSIHPPSSILHPLTSILYPILHPLSSIQKYSLQSSIHSHTWSVLIPRILRKSWPTHGTERSSCEEVVEIGYFGRSNVNLINKSVKENVFGETKNITLCSLKFHRWWCFSFLIFFGFWTTYWLGWHCLFFSTAMKIGRSSSIEHFCRLNLWRVTQHIVHVSEALFVSFAGVYSEFTEILIVMTQIMKNLTKNFLRPYWPHNITSETT